MLARAATWWTILRISLEERLVYRGDFALGTLMRFLPIVTQVFLWAAVFAAMAATGGSRQIVGYSYRDMIAYYLLTMIVRAFSSMPGLATGIARRHPRRHGQEIPHPADRHARLPAALPHGPQTGLLHRGGGAVRAGVLPLPRLFQRLARRPRPCSAFVASLVMSFLLGFFLEATLGMIGFWFLEVNSLLFVFMLLNFFFSGHMFPDRHAAGHLGHDRQADSAAIPGLFPRRRVPRQGDRPGTVDRACGTQFAWVVFFIVASRVVFRLGTRHYSGYGG